VDDVGQEGGGGGCPKKSVFARMSLMDGSTLFCSYGGVEPEGAKKTTLPPMHAR